MEFCNAIVYLLFTVLIDLVLITAILIFSISLPVWLYPILFYVQVRNYMNYNNIVTLVVQCTCLLGHANCCTKFSNTVQHSPAICKQLLLFFNDTYMMVHVCM